MLHTEHIGIKLAVSASFQVNGQLSADSKWSDQQLLTALSPYQIAPAENPDVTERMVIITGTPEAQFKVKTQWMCMLICTNMTLFHADNVCSYFEDIIAT